MIRTGTAARRGAALSTTVAVLLAVGLAGCSGGDVTPAGKAPATSGPVAGSSDSPSATDSAPTVPGAGSFTPGTGSVAGADAEWTLTSLTDATGTVTSPLPAPTLDLRTRGEVTGNGGCNSFRAAYDGDADALRVSPVLSTRRACVRGGDLEARYLAALEKVTAAKSGPDLTLTGPGVSLVFSKDEKRSADDRDTQPGDD